MVRSREELVSGLRPAPITLQSCIERAVDLRVVVVGNEVFAASVRFHGEFEDWRLDANVMFDRHELQSDLRAKVLALMRSLGLVTGSLDLTIGPDGVPYFFEVNPSGQFLFLELELKLPVSLELAKCLTGNRET